MAENTMYVATEPLFVGRARAANPGDLIHPSVVKSNGWQDKVSPVGSQAADEVPGTFDPSTHNVEEVNAHLAGADDAERDRVLAAEQAGKNRTGVTG